MLNLDIELPYLKACPFEPPIYSKDTSQAQTQPNLFAAPGDTQAVILEATNRLTAQQGNEIWIGALGTDENWGGCNVWASQDGTTYKQIGAIETPARLGILAAILPSGSDPDTVNSLVVDLAENSAPLDAGTTTDADNANTICFVDGEILSYSACAITGQEQYTMGGYIRRGQMGSSIGSHAVNSLFLRLDDAVFKFTYDPTWAGQTIYLKFQSFNAYGNAPQDLSSITATTFAIPGKNPGTVDVSSGLVIANHPEGAGPLGWTPAATTTDAGVNYGTAVAGSVALPSGVNSTDTYARWIGYLIPSVTGVHTIGVNSSDGANLYIGTQQLINSLQTLQAANGTLGYKQSATINLTKGVPYPILLEWQHGASNPPEIQLAWTQPSGSIQLIPAGNLSTSPASITGNLAGTWWNGTASNYYPTGASFVDPSGPGVVAKGSVPPSLSSIALNGMTWTTTSTSVTFAWTQTPIYRADGTVSAPVPSGTQAVTGLKASQSYTAYPYYDEATSALKWVGSELLFPTVTSVLLNGTSGFIQTSTGGTHPDNGTGQFTLEFWIKTTSSTQQGVMSFSAPQGSGAETVLNVQVLITATGEIEFSYVNTTPAVKSLTTSGAGVNDGAWHHVVIQFATGGTASIWIDNGNLAAFSAQGAIATAGSTAYWHLGMAHGAATWPGTANTFLNGQLANVAVYSGTPITQAQIANHFIAGVNQGFAAYAAVIAADSPFYYWKLNETSGTSAADSASTNTGTYSGGFTLNQQAPVVVPTGSPAIMWPYKNFLCTQAQSLQSRIPLSVGSLNPSTPASGGGSGGGGGIGGGGRGGCFSGNTRVQTDRGNIAIRDVQVGDLVLTARGTKRRVLNVLKHEITDADTYLPVEPGRSPIVQRRTASGAWLVTDMGKGELVTLNHSLLDKGQWKRAYEVLNGVIAYPLPVYNLEIEHNADEDPLAPDAECSFALANGWLAHNSLLQQK